jgi:hypothetical protein
MIIAFPVKAFPALALLGAFFFLALLVSGLPASYVFRGVQPFLWLFLFTRTPGLDEKQA